MGNPRPRSRRVVFFLAAALVTLRGTAAAAELSKKSETPAARAAARIPTFFVPNAGQTRPEVRFQAANGASTVLFADGQIVTFTRRPAASLDRTSPSSATRLGVGGERTATSLSVDSVSFEGSRAAPKVLGLDPIRARISFLRGGDPSRWRTGIPAYTAIVYRDLYPGIDLRFESAGPELRGTFVVAPGADPSRILWRRRTGSGSAAGGALTAAASHPGRPAETPRVSQSAGGRSRPVLARYTFSASGRHGIAFPEGYDVSRALLVDARIFDSTYFGGGGDDIGYAIAADSEGGVYLTGATLSTDLPAAGPLDATCGSDGTCNGGLSDAFVAKIDPSQTGADSLVYATYLGGSADDVGVGIAVDGDGSAYVAGVARGGFPTTAGAYQTGFGSESGVGADGFLSRLSADGTALLYSTYFGGSNGDGVWAVAADGDGNAWLAGQTYSSDFPSTPGTDDEECGLDGDCDALSDAFLARIDTGVSGANALVFSSFLGGSGDDQAFGIALAAAGSIAVTGRTTSSDFPTESPFQALPGGGFDGFLSVFDATASNRLYATYLGGGGYDDVYGIAANAAGELSFTGTTGSSDFPTTPGGAQLLFGGVFDAYFARLDPGVGGVGSLLYATYLGGSNDDEGFGLAIDDRGDAYVAGFSLSTDMPAPTCALQPGSGGDYDAFVAKVRAGASGPSSLAYSSYLGGLGIDAAYSVALDGDRNVLLGGQTRSADFPLANAADATLSGAGGDAFVTAISLRLPAPVSISPRSGPAGGGTPVTIQGMDFQAGATASIGGVAAGAVVVTGDTQITGTSGALSPGTLNDLGVGNPDTCEGILGRAWLADFLDVDATHLFHDAVEKIFRAGVTTGCGTGIYCPGDSVTRDQMAIFLLRGKYGSSYMPPPATGTAFDDVPAGAFAAAWIEQLLAEQITTGCGGGNYCPTSGVNRASMAVMLLRAKHGGTYQPPPAVGLFDDVPASDEFARWIEQLLLEGITSGCGDDNFCPELVTTRGEMAAFLARTFGLL